MDEEFDTLYRAEQRTGKIALLFTTLAIVTTGTQFIRAAIVNPVKSLKSE